MSLTTPGRDQYPDHTYTYLFCDLRTDELLAELPLQDVRYSTELNGIGSLSATVPYNDQTAALDPETACTPGRTAVYVDRDGVIVWGGIVWTRRPARGGKELQAAEFLSYYQRRHVTTTLSTAVSAIADDDYVPDGQRLFTDQKYLVWALLRWAHIRSGGSIGLDLGALTANPDGVNRYVTYLGHERPEIYKAIAELAAAEDGFDFGVEVGWTNPANNEPPRRYRRMRTWYPRRGRTAAASGLVFSKGGQGSSILSYDWPEDGTELATDVTGIGKGTADAAPIRTATATDLINSGWPLLETVTKYDDITEDAHLQTTVNAELAARSQAHVQPIFEVLADGDPEFGSYQVGDEALFVIDPEPLMPAGRSEVLRIVSIENTARSGPERVRLSCAAV